MISDLDFINLPLEDARAYLNAKDPYPTEVEFGFRSLVEGQDTGLHIREDGVIELYAGAAKIILDPSEGTVALIGNNLLLQSHLLEVGAPEFRWQRHPIESAWKGDIKAVRLANANALSGLYVLTQPIVENGDQAVALSQYMQPLGLFKPQDAPKDASAGLTTLLPKNGT